MLMLEGCRKHQRLSQLQLYEHYYSYGMGICLRFSKNRNEAQEILNDGFLKVFKKIHLFNPEQAFEPWLRKVLVNTSIDYYRKHHKDAPETLTFEEAWSGTTVNEAIENLAYQELIQYLHYLPPAYRIAFNLFVIEGMTHPEIAKELAISVGASKSNLSKARNKLKQLIAGTTDFTLKQEEHGTK